MQAIFYFKHPKIYQFFFLCNSFLIRPFKYIYMYKPKGWSAILYYHFVGEIEVEKSVTSGWGRATQRDGLQSFKAMGLVPGGGQQQSGTGSLCRPPARGWLAAAISSNEWNLNEPTFKHLPPLSWVLRMSCQCCNLGQEKSPRANRLLLQENMTKC